MGGSDDLKSPCKALSKPMVDQKRSRAEDENLQMNAGGSVLIPESLDCLGPGWHFLDLVDNEDSPLLPSTACFDTPNLPLLFQSDTTQRLRVIRRNELYRNFQSLSNLPGDSGLSRLPGAGQDLDKSPLFEESRTEVLKLLSPVGHLSLISSIR